MINVVKKSENNSENLKSLYSLITSRKVKTAVRTNTSKLLKNFVLDFLYVSLFLIWYMRACVCVCAFLSISIFVHFEHDAWGYEMSEKKQHLFRQRLEFQVDQTHRMQAQAGSKYRTPNSYDIYCTCRFSCMHIINA